MGLGKYRSPSCVRHQSNLSPSTSGWGGQVFFFFSPWPRCHVGLARPRSPLRALDQAPSFSSSSLCVLERSSSPCSPWAEGTLDAL